MSKKKTPLRSKNVRKYLESILDGSMHAMRVLSMANASLGVIQAGSLSVSAIGHGLAEAELLNPKHAIKQVDRLLSNEGIDVWDVFEKWVPFVIGSRKDVVAAMDWTEFDADDQSTLTIHLLTNHGRATPLVWTTVKKSTIKGWRNIHEDTLVKLLGEVLPEGVQLTLVADRGFGDVGLYSLLEELGFSYVIRFRSNIVVEAAGTTPQPAKDWVPKSGRPRLIRDARVTRRRARVPVVVCVKARGMKDSWCLASNLSDAKASALVKLYGKRFTIEERYRDSKNIRYGMGLSSISISDPNRRDRLLLMDAFAGALLTLLGAAGESLGWDRMLKANTVKKRTHSLFRQGLHYYRTIPAMTDERLQPLMNAFVKNVRQHAVFQEVFGLL